MKAAIYCRISSDKTGEQAGVTRQLEDCRALAAAIEWTVVEEYVDNDISATSGRARPAYQRMLAAIASGEVEAIVTWAPDRLYRKARDLEPLIDIMEKAGASIRTVRAGEIDLSTPNGRMIARITGAVATQEGEVKSERWRRSIRQRRENGQAPGWGPRLFGYTREGVIEEAEADVIRFAALALVEGQSLRGVTKKVNSLGALTTLGNPWSTQGLKQLLSNARLAGHSTLNGDTVGVGQWEAILSDELYQQVQATFAIRRGQAAPTARVALLLGIVKCSACGTNLVSARLAKRPGQTEGRRVYRCPTPPRGAGCGRISVDAESVEQYVEGYARERLADPRVRERQTQLSQDAGSSAAEVVALEERLGELEAELDKPGTPVATITRAMDRTRERIEALRAAAAPMVALPTGREWPKDLARRARLVRVAVESVEVLPVVKRGSNKFDGDARVRVTPRT